MSKRQNRNVQKHEVPETSAQETNDERLSRLREEAFSCAENGYTAREIWEIFYSQEESVSYEQVTEWHAEWEAVWRSTDVDFPNGMHEWCSGRRCGYEDGVGDCVAAIVKGSKGRISLKDIHQALTADNPSCREIITNPHVAEWVVAIDKSKWLSNISVLAQGDTAAEIRRLWQERGESVSYAQAEEFVKNAPKRIQ